MNNVTHESSRLIQFSRLALLFIGCGAVTFAVSEGHWKKIGTATEGTLTAESGTALGFPYVATYTETAQSTTYVGTSSGADAIAYEKNHDTAWESI